MKQILACLFLCSVVNSACFADGTESEPQTAHVRATATPGNAPPIKGSNASFDKRLPPFLPGERVIANGKEMKIWSTSGGVSSSEAPQPAQDRRVIEDVVGNKSIIIDAREGEGHLGERGGPRR